MILADTIHDICAGVKTMAGRFDSVGILHRSSNRDVDNLDIFLRLLLVDPGILDFMHDI